MVPPGFKAPAFQRPPIMNKAIRSFTLAGRVEKFQLGEDFWVYTTCYFVQPHHGCPANGFQNIRVILPISIKALMSALVMDMIFTFENCFGKKLNQKILFALQTNSSSR